MIETIEAKDLKFNYDTRIVLENLNFSIENPVVCLNSKNGGGKSTLLKLLCGSLSPTSGELLFNGVSVSEYSFEDWATFRKSIGFSFDYGGLLSNRTLFENLALPLQYHSLYPADEIQTVVEEYLVKYELINQKNSRPSEVTGNQRKAACVARSMIMNPKLLLLDDPTTGLKPSTKKMLMDELQKLLDSRSVHFMVYASEDIEFCSKFQGQVIDCAPAKSLQEAA